MDSSFLLKTGRRKSEGEEEHNVRDRCPYNPDYKFPSR